MYLQHPSSTKGNEDQANFNFVESIYFPELRWNTCVDCIEASHKNATAKENKSGLLVSNDYKRRERIRYAKLVILLDIFLLNGIDFEPGSFNLPLLDDTRQ